MKARYSLVVFDLDGTLVDSAPELAAAIDHMLKIYGQECAGVWRVRTWIGEGVRQMIKRAWKWATSDYPDQAIFNRLYAGFNEAYEARLGSECRLYDGVAEILDEFAADGMAMAIATNKSERFVNPLLRGLNIDRYFQKVVGGDSLPTRKPDPAPLKVIADHTRVESNSAVMVGDTVTDIRAAHAAGFSSVAVTYGYGDISSLRSAAPDFLIDAPPKLIKAVGGYC